MVEPCGATLLDQLLSVRGQYHQAGVVRPAERLQGPQGRVRCRRVAGQGAEPAEPVEGSPARTDATTPHPEQENLNTVRGEQHTDVACRVPG